MRRYEVRPILSFSTTARPHSSSAHEYAVNLAVENKTASSILFSQITTMSSTWACSPQATNIMYVAFHNSQRSATESDYFGSGVLPPNQSARATFAVNRWEEATGVEATRQFISNKLRSVLHGSTVEVSDPPPTRLLCRHVSAVCLSMR